MFNNSQKINISGGSFNVTTNYSTVNGPSLDAVYRRVAPNAILNAGGRADEARCHPGTRKEVLSRIEKWRDAQDRQTPPMFWLSGPAGAGKTAIVQTIAERCNAQRIPQANFFFFRTDNSRNNISPLVATLVHQITLLYPSLRNPVATVLSTNPLILDSSLEDQLIQLIVAPLQAIRKSSPSYAPPLLLIDGLDECKSEDKHSQQQILHAFDKALVEYPCLFRLLVASRDESQIQVAFNDIYSPLLPLYLNNKYLPKNDIRSFVNDEFKRLRKTHPLAYTLDAIWPSVEDIEGIVWKSSGQFIYAATIMRFIFNSSASPALSLARVQGAAQISANSKSPFSHLDTIYAYILSQVDDQQALKDILHAQLLLKAFLPSSGKFCCANPPKPVDILEAYNHEYTEVIVRSCLAELTSIAQYTEYRELLFHHASFPDYLLDQSRSGEYFVDIDAFNFKIQPTVWRACRKLEQNTGLGYIALTGLRRLRQLPPGFLSALTAQDLLSVGEQQAGTMYFSPADHFTHIHSLCTCGDDMTSYQQILRQWIYTLPKLQSPGDGTFGYRCDEQWPPRSLKYHTMIVIEDNLETEPHSWIDVHLCPETDSDACEIALWLKNLLCRIHGEIYPKSIQKYTRLLQKWVSWAAQNDIPLDGVDHLPMARWYCAMARLERTVPTGLRGRIDVALRPETDADAREIAVWLSTILHRIHEEIYPKSVNEYTMLIWTWVSWATWSDIPLDGVDDLPKVRSYRARAHIEQNVTAEPHDWIDIALRPETASDARETAAWLNALLHRIHGEVYHKSGEKYKRILKKWMSWAARNDISLEGVDDLPKARW
ncbi:hypothetical protein D9619_012439 [Psilocybe cf. subviscida]|uniref:NACHT domain-containing protein n=1 Tax=Psilocybe cf. subviscida TaxID=2480587 RepID=A0A8H5ARW5_9AGAR|nr:hypothetical protein D9619_012439 [Psilocybe cf. subviscida]